MIKLVLISERNLQPTSNVGDIVDVHDGDVELGPAYDTYDILEVDGFNNAEEFRQVLSSTEPERRTVHKSSAPIGEWSLDEPERKQVWKDGGLWKEIKKLSKHTYCVDSTLKSFLTDPVLSKNDKLTQITSKLNVNFKSMPENSETIITVYEKSKSSGK